MERRQPRHRARAHGAARLSEAGGGLPGEGLPAGDVTGSPRGGGATPRGGGPVVIAGAGIAGLSAAVFLADAGMPCLVAERRPGLAREGAGVQVSPNASRHLLRAGLGPALARLGAEPERLSVRAARDGRTLTRMLLGAAARERYGAPYLVLRRADLQAALLDAARARGVPLRFGREVLGATPGEDGLTVETLTPTGTREALSAAALLGADGLRSRIAPLLGDASAPRFARAEAWRATIPVAPGCEAFAGEVTAWLGRGAHLVTYPVGGGRELNLVAVTRAAAPAPGWSRPGRGGELMGQFEGWAAEVRDLLAAAADGWRVWSLFDRPPRARIARGRIALLGDAAHPMLPFLAQGAAMGIEDAADLAARLGAGGDVEEALVGYARARRGRTGRVQAAARRNGRVFHLGPLLAPARDAVLARLSGERMLARYDWLYGG